MSQGLLEEGKDGIRMMLKQFNQKSEFYNCSYDEPVITKKSQTQLLLVTRCKFTLYEH